MEERIEHVALGRLVAHPDNPNKMSGSTFAKLVRNIERTGRYEPLVVRPFGKRKGRFQIINGHHRFEALKKLGHKKAAVIVWDVDDEQTDILLATLNRLAGSDVLAAKLALLKRLTERMNARQLGRLLPQTPGQIKRLIDLKMPKIPAKMPAAAMRNPLVFFVSDEQKQVIEEALSLANSSFRAEADGTGATSPKRKRRDYPRDTPCLTVGACGGTRTLGVMGSDRPAGKSRVIQGKPTAAQRNAAALTTIARCFVESRGRKDDENED